MSRRSSEGRDMRKKEGMVMNSDGLFTQRVRIRC